MKKLSFSTLMAAGLLLAACSENEVIVEGGAPGDTNPPQLSDGYMALNISMPINTSSVPAASRAVNDDFADGTPDEYRLTDCALLFFDGDTESDATLIYAADVTPPSTGTPGNTNITTSYKFVTGISGHDTNKTLYALAALNYKNVLAIADGKATVNGGSTEIKKLADLYTAIGSVDLTKNGTAPYFFMTNAVLSTKPGGSTAPSADKVFQLAELDGSKIYTSRTDAENDPAGEILVERAVAKATLSLTPGIAMTIGDATIKSVKWVVDNMEPTTFIARNPGDNSYIAYRTDAGVANPYRFVSHTSTKDNTSSGTKENYYRTYWCIDPQYNTGARGMLEYKDNPMADCKNFVTAGATPIYCYENTFDVVNQSYSNTTRAILEVELNGGEFYTLNGSAYYTKATLDTYIQTFTVGNELVKNAIQGQLVAGQNFSQGDFEELAGHIDYTLSYSPADAKCTVETLTLAEGHNLTGDKFKEENEGDAAKAVEDVLGAVKDALNDRYSITKYVEGKMYYEVRFAHFREELTPWNTGDDWEDPAPSAGSGTADAYPGCNIAGDAATRAANRYLGRYGMVRNNWYDVEVMEFMNFGSPINPSGKVSSDSTPDDHLENNIAVRIHLLSWAKRKQQVRF